MIWKQDAAGPSDEGIQSNVPVKQTSENFSNVQLNIQNKQGQQKCNEGQGKKRDPRHGRPMAPVFDRYAPLNTSLEDVYLHTYNTE